MEPKENRRGILISHKIDFKFKKTAKKYKERHYIMIESQFTSKL